MGIKKHILVVEDDRSISTILKIQLEKSGYEVTCAFNGVECLEKIKDIKIDLILLDWMLPKISGIEVCKIVKSKLEIPIIFLTAKIRETDIIQGLEVGGDDYITKPFKFGILDARIKSNLRKYNHISVDILTWGDLSLNTSTHLVLYRDNQILLSKYEFNLLRIFLISPNSIISRIKIIHELWGYLEDENSKGNNLDVIINSLRKKISPRDKKMLIKTHRGMGYGLI